MIRVTNIQRFCLNDGPGIRTTVFLKGCPIHCPWCSNPENLNYDFTPYRRKLGDGSVIDGLYGKDYSAEELYKIIVKDVKFYREEGGVTFSGGEPLFQAKHLEEALKMLKADEVNIGFETSLHISPSLLEVCMPYMDFAYVDVKTLEPDICASVLGGNVEIYFNNVREMHQNNINITFRIPCSNEFTLTTGNIYLIRNMLLKVPGHRIEIFKVHNLGSEKYRSIGSKSWVSTVVEESRLYDFKDRLVADGHEVHIINI